MDCLNLKLKGEFNNNELPYVDKIIFKAPAAGVYALEVGGISNDAPVIIDVEGNGVLKFTSDQSLVSTPYTSPYLSNFKFTASDDTAKVIVHNKNNLHACNGFFNVSFGKFLLLAGSSIKSIKISGEFAPYNLHGDIKELANCTALEKFLTISSIYSPYIKGDISSFAKLSNLKELSFRYSMVSGTIESFVEGQITNGRTTCNGIIWTSTLNDLITFDGIASIVKNNNGSLSWAPTSNANEYLITFTYGTESVTKTITVS